MPLWAWITLVFTMDAVVWGLLLGRARAQVRVHQLQLRETMTRLQEALEAPKGLRPRLLEGVAQNLERHAGKHDLWKD